MKQEVKLEYCPRPALRVDTQAQANTIKKFGLTNERAVVGMCPGAEFGPAKRWPDAHYAEVAEHAIKQGQQVWLFGSKKDREVTEKIRDALTKEAQSHCYNLAGSTSLIEAVDLLAVCDTVVSNDSGLMHISAAVGANVIAVYGSSSPSYTPPLSDSVKIINNDVECRPCFKRTCHWDIWIA
ncbi:ADP-heptose-lipooligosaccharide heptosyltransferase II [Vibrio maritimus]|uniref:lipopolysaccharide heptosyltransferase II n=1 Tax=Vibrio maritimus TaxID=990268 RepID=A0A090TFQ6_9VIBR|nr:ADP-heptose-lipooligosaccharide heptosyltransferase II [Vibrio maritimus]